MGYDMEHAVAERAYVVLFPILARNGAIALCYLRRYDYKVHQMAIGPDNENQV
jgi:hypothetical protein